MRQKNISMHRFLYETEMHAEQDKNERLLNANYHKENFTPLVFKVLWKIKAALNQSFTKLIGAYVFFDYFFYASHFMQRYKGLTYKDLMFDFIKFYFIIFCISKNFHIIKFSYFCNI